MDNLESQLESMDIGRDVPPDLAAEIDALAEDDRINDELSRLKSEGHRVLIYSQMTRMIDILEVSMRNLL